MAQWGALTATAYRGSLEAMPVPPFYQWYHCKVSSPSCWGARCCSVPLIGTVGWLPPSLSTPFDLNIFVGMATTKLTVIGNQVINCHIFPTSMLCQGVVVTRPYSWYDYVAPLSLGLYYILEIEGQNNRTAAVWLWWEMISQQNPELLFQYYTDFIPNREVKNCQKTPERHVFLSRK